MNKAFVITLLLALGTSFGVMAQGSTKQDNSGSAAAPSATTPTGPGGAAIGAPSAPTAPGGAGAATGTPSAGSPASGPDPQNTSPHPSPLSPAESGGPRPGGGVGGGTR